MGVSEIHVTEVQHLVFCQEFCVHIYKRYDLEFSCDVFVWFWY